jgi:hypothetical protein
MTVAELDALCAGQGWQLITCVIGFAVVRATPYTHDMYAKGLLYGFVSGSPQVLADKIAGQRRLQASLTAMPDPLPERGRR